MDKFLFIGEHYITDFVNTQLKPTGELIDLLQTSDDIKRWFKEVGLIESIDEIKVNDIFFKEIKEYRDFIKRCFFEYLDNKNDLNQLLEKTNEILKQNEVFLQVSNSEGEYKQTFSPCKKDINILLVIIAIELAKLISSQQFKYLKRCSNHECVLLFIDTSKNHSRRWCSMEFCGNRSKVNNFNKRNKNKKA